MWREMKTRELTATALMLIACAAPAAAQDDGMPQGKRPTVSRDAPPSSNATVNLINLLVKQGTLSEEQAAVLVKQADDEAYVARQATRDAAAKAKAPRRRRPAPPTRRHRPAPSASPTCPRSSRSSSAKRSGPR